MHENYVPNMLYIELVPQDELLAELEDIEQAEVDKELLKVGEPSTKRVETDDCLIEFPSVRKSNSYRDQLNTTSCIFFFVATTPLQQESDDELKELAGWAN